MIQQALTIYKERIPVYLLNERSDLLVIKPGAPDGNPKEYQSKEEAIFVEQFIRMGKENKDFKRINGQPVRPKYLDPIPFAIETLEKQIGLSHFELGCSYRQFKTVVFDYFYIRTLRNMTNHANDEVYADRMERVLTDSGYPPFQSLTAKDTAKLLEDALDFLESMDLSPDAANDNLPELCEAFKNNPRKVFANVYIDDHNAGGLRFETAHKTQGGAK